MKETSKASFEIPPLIPGDGRTLLSAAAGNQLIKRLNALSRLKVQRGAADEFRLSDANAILTIARDQNDGTGTGGSSVSVYKVTSIANIASNYILAKPAAFDASNTETLGAEVQVALPWQLRDAQTTTRTPEYVVDDYIVVSEVEDGAGVVVGGVQLTLIDLGIGRIEEPAGGGAAERFRVKSVQGDYTTCRTWDGTTEGGTDIYIAKPPKLRHSITSESIEGTTVSYTYGSRSGNNDGYRKASAGGVDIYEIVMPVYITNDEIFATKPTRGTDVTVSSVELEYIDINVDGRAWGMVV